MCDLKSVVITTDGNVKTAPVKEDGHKHSLKHFELYIV